MKRVFLQVKHFPTATFELAQVTGLPPEGIAVGAEAEADLGG